MHVKGPRFLSSVSSWAQPPLPCSSNPFSIICVAHSCWFNLLLLKPWWNVLSDGWGQGTTPGWSSPWEQHQAGGCKAGRARGSTHPLTYTDPLSWKCWGNCGFGDGAAEWYLSKPKKSLDYAVVSCSCSSVWGTVNLRFVPEGRLF